MILPGTIVKVFDNRIFIDDVKTPISVTMKKAIVLRRYGIISDLGWKYPDLVDVKFFHDNRESKGHFTEFVQEEK